MLYFLVISDYRRFLICYLWCGVGVDVYIELICSEGSCVKISFLVLSRMLILNLNLIDG